MNSVTTSGVGVRALREFALAVRSGPFRVALVLSVLVHLVILVVFGWGKLGRDGGSERRIPLMRVRLLPPASPAGVPAAPAIGPALKQPRREQPGRPAVAVPPRLPALAPRAAAAAVDSGARESALAPAPEVSVRDESRERQVSGETAPPPVLAALPQVSAPRAVQEPLAPEAGAPATGSASSPSSPAAAEAGTGAAAAAATERDGHQMAGATGAAAGATGTAAAAPTAAPAAATASHQGPGLRDLTVVRHRIDAHKVYPQIAVRNGWEGRVLVEMRLEGDGSLTDVRLLEGSGYAVLDDATIVAVRRASPFPPIARVLTVPVEYRLVP